MAKRFILNLIFSSVCAAGLSAASIQVSTVADVVADDGVCSCREAIQNANSDSQNGRTSPGECAAGSGTDSIQVPGGIYRLTSSLAPSSDMSINGAGSFATFIEAGSNRVLEPTAGAIELRDLSLKGSDTYGASGPVSLLVERVVFEATGWGIRHTTQATGITVRDSTFIGGGRGIQYGAASGTALLENSTFIGQGTAGIFVNYPMTIRNCSFQGKGAGNGLQLATSAFVVEHCTVLGYNYGLIQASGSSTVLGSIIRGNATTDINASGGTVSSLGGSFYGSSAGAFSAHGSDSSADPLLQPLADNGGHTKTFALGGGSPAIDAVSATGTASDQRGIARPQGSAADAGAFETGGPMLTATPTPGCASGVLGNGVLGNAMDAAAYLNFEWWMVPVHVTVSAQAVALKVNLNQAMGGLLRMALFQRTGPYSGTLITASAEVTPLTGVNTLPIGPVSLPAGDYWVGMSTDQQINLYVNASVFAHAVAWTEDFVYKAAPLSFTATGLSSFDLAMQLELSCGAASPTPTASPTATLTASASPTLTATPSASPSATATPPATATTTPTPSPTPSASPSPGPQGAVTAVPPQGKPVAVKGLTKRGEPICVSSSVGDVDRITVYNLMGQLVTVISNDPCVATGSLSPGIYHLVVMIQGKSHKLKAAIQP